MGDRVTNRHFFDLRRDLPDGLILRDGMRVLEIGTGHGETAANVALAFRDAGLAGEIVAVDLDPKRGAETRATASSAGVSEMVRFRVADARAMPPLGLFDLVLCVSCLSQITFEKPRAPPRTLAATVKGWAWSWRPTLDRAPEETAKGAERACAALISHWESAVAPGGALVLVDLARSDSDGAHRRGVALFEANRWPLIPSSVLASALAQAGFDDVRTRILPGERFDSKGDVPWWLGGGGRAAGENASPMQPTPWPLPTVDETGDYAFSRLVLQARRAPRAADRP